MDQFKGKMNQFFVFGYKLIADDIVKVDLYFWLNQKIFQMNKNESLG
jgi:hypothetical protein